jgi:hypothetical protein
VWSAGGGPSPQVCRDGTVYKTFDDTGLDFPPRPARHEGPLTLDGDRLHAFGFNTPGTIYTGFHFAAEWREHSYFAELDEARVDAALELTLDICRRNDIDPVFYFPSTTYDFPRCFHVATIVCHSNCRKDKLDLLLPEWVYQKIEAAGIRLQS